MKQIQDNDALIYLAIAAEAIMFIVGFLRINQCSVRRYIF